MENQRECLRYYKEDECGRSMEGDSKVGTGGEGIKTSDSQLLE